MRILYYFVTLMLTAGLALAACVMPPAAPGGTIPVPTAESAGESAAEACPAPTDGTQLIINPSDGYCFLVPTGYTTAEPSPGNLTVFAPAETQGHRERALIHAEPAEGRAPADSAGAKEAEVTVIMGTLTRTVTTLGGEEAIVLEVLPGQDLNRMVYVVHGDTLYSLMFIPLDPAAGEAYTQMEELYSLLTSSFIFLDAASPPAADAASADASTVESAARLSWEGSSAQGACLALTILDRGLDTGEAQVGPCGDTPKTVEFSTGSDSEWAAVLSHFAPVDVTTEEGHLRFQGQGTASGPAWEQALNTWAKFTAQELQAGRTSAAGRTVLAWRLAESPDHDQAGQCEMLIVLAYGYAYANLAPCDGNGPAQLVAQGWLETAEWETLTGWLTGAARIEDAAGYLDAHGDTPLTADDLSAWAAAVYERIVGK